MRFQSFLDILEHYAGVSPEAPALVCEDGGEKRAVSYAQLLAAVHDRAESLKICAGRCEAILADGSYDCVLEIFAAVAAGLPVALLDADAPDETLREQLNASSGEMRICAKNWAFPRPEQRLRSPATSCSSPPVRPAGRKPSC